MGLQSLIALLLKEFDKNVSWFYNAFFTTRKAVELIYIVTDYMISKVAKCEAIEKNC